MHKRPFYDFLMPPLNRTVTSIVTICHWKDGGTVHEFVKFWIAFEKCDHHCWGLLSASPAILIPEFERPGRRHPRVILKHESEPIFWKLRNKLVRLLPNEGMTDKLEPPKPPDFIPPNYFLWGYKELQKVDRKSTRLDVFKQFQKFRQTFKLLSMHCIHINRFPSHDGLKDMLIIMPINN